MYSKYFRIPSWLRRRPKPVPEPPRVFPKIIYLIPPRIVVTPPEEDD